jgi:hypothetical protein
LVQRHGYLSMALIDRTKGMPASTLYCKRFGGLRKAYRLIGYVERRWRRGITPSGRPMGLSDEEMLQALRLVWREHGRLTREVVSSSKTVPSISAYQLRFGSLSQAYRLIGFTPDAASVRARRSPLVVSDKCLLTQLGRLLQKHGRLSRRIIDEDEDAPTRGTLVRRFGSLQNAYRLVDYTPNSLLRRSRRA